jgi:hypothetical protein
MKLNDVMKQLIAEDVGEIARIVGYPTGIDWQAYEGDISRWLDTACPTWLVIRGGYTMKDTTKYLVIVVKMGDDCMEAVNTLDPVETLDEAKEAARQAGYTVIDYGEGGACETTDAWDHKSVKHIVTILPRI